MCRGYDNHHCHNKPQTGNGPECGWHHAQKRWVENLEDFEKDLVEVRPQCWEVEVWPWCWEVGVQLWSWGFEIGPCRQNWVSATGTENWVLFHWVEFSPVVPVVKFFRSWPVKMNWDLKHHKMCRKLGVLLV